MCWCFYEDKAHSHNLKCIYLLNSKNSCVELRFQRHDQFGTAAAWLRFLECSIGAGYVLDVWSATSETRKLSRFMSRNGDPRCTVQHPADNPADIMAQSIMAQVYVKVATRR